MTERPPLRLLTDTTADLIRQECLVRAARIDKLSIDRSMFTSCPLPRWSAEALAGEEKWGEGYRASLTIGDRIEAWRRLFAKHAKGVAR